MAKINFQKNNPVFSKLSMRILSNLIFGGMLYANRIQTGSF